MQIIMAARNRWKSDDMVRQKNIISRYNKIESDFIVFKEYIDLNLSPLVICLFESLSIKVAIDEQDDQDKQKIALYGHRATEKLLSYNHQVTTDTLASLHRLNEASVSSPANTSRRASPKRDITAI